MAAVDVVSPHVPQTPETANMIGVNERIAAAGINIAAQYLSTNEEVGYVVIDVDHSASLPVLRALCDVPATIRCRILY